MTSSKNQGFFLISRQRHPTMAGEPEKKATEMAKDQREDSGDWLADIFDAADEGAITSLEMTEMSLPQETIAALEAEGSGAAGTPGSGDKRGGKRVGARRRSTRSRGARSCEERR